MSKMTQILGVLSFSLIAAASQAASYRLQYRLEDGRSTLIGVTSAQGLAAPASLGSEGQLLRSLPYFITHGEGREGESAQDMKVWFEERLVEESVLPRVARQMLRSRTMQNNTETLVGAEFRAIREQGPATNRINLTIIGDGYTEAEREKFFADVEWTTQGLFETPTFESYLPLFNVYAVFVPSNQSGIGDGRPKDTAFRLYRDPAGSKRAIMPGNQNAMEAALRYAPRTDYPIVLANDDYYGGLGGRWAISTSSRSSGLIVLRHELGHNFGEVGEEYDNGQVYMGANASRSANVPWRHWVEGSSVAVHDSQLLSGEYVWQNLRGNPYSANIRMPSRASRLELKISTVGWDSSRDVDVRLNGASIAYDGIFHDDRSFFDVDMGLRSAGEQLSLSIQERVDDRDNVLGFALAYAYPESYDFTADKIGAFSSYDNWGSKTYRPTHDGCLMRDMLKPHFCSVDQENMWLKFLARMELLDGVEVTPAGPNRAVTVTHPPLENLDLSWFRKEGSAWIELPELRGRSDWAVPEGLRGDFRVDGRLPTKKFARKARALARAASSDSNQVSRRRCTSVIASGLIRCRCSVM
jgi:hypothetical protein